MLTLLAPEAENKCTGGYIYNMRILRELDPAVFSGILLPDPPPEPDKLKDYSITPEQTLLLDSLYFNNAGWVSRLKHSRPGRIAMLVHYLPSTDPFISAEEAEKLYNAEKICLDCCCLAIATSAYSAEMIRLLFKDAPLVSVVCPGADFNPGHRRLSASREKNSETVLLTIANWLPAKNHHFLIDILKNLKDKEWRWKIYGYGENSAYAAEFREKALKAGIYDRIEAGGAVNSEEAAKQMAEADIYLYPSIFESYGMSVAEALAASLPVIANRTGGIPEAAGSSGGAYLCTSGDRDEWTDVLRRLIKYPERRKLMSEAAWKRAGEMPGWRESAEKLAGFLEGSG